MQGTPQEQLTYQETDLMSWDQGWDGEVLKKYLPG